MLRQATRRLLARAATTTTTTTTRIFSTTDSASVEAWRKLVEPPKTPLVFKQLRPQNPSSAPLVVDVALPYSPKLVLDRKDQVNNLWRVVNEMKQNGYEMETSTYVEVVERFCNLGMIEDAVDLYEFMMNAATKPGVQDALFLMQKVLTNERLYLSGLHMNLFSRVMITFTESGGVLTDSILDEIFKSLDSIDRFIPCDDVLEAMENCGFQLTGLGYDRIVYAFAKSGRLFPASLILTEMHSRGYSLHYSTFKLVIEGSLAEQKTEEAEAFHGFMMQQGFPPYVDPFIKHISKYGTDLDAINCLRRMNLLSLQYISVCIRMIEEAFIKFGRHNEARNCISEFPDSIRNHAHVLNLLHTLKPKISTPIVLTFCPTKNSLETPKC